MRPAWRGGIIGRASGDQYSAKALMAEIEFDLLKWPLNQERGVGVSYWALSSYGHPGGEANHHLLADTHVDHSIWVAPGHASRTKV
jgi:hypothetical protein